MGGLDPPGQRFSLDCKPFNKILRLGIKDLSLFHGRNPHLPVGLRLDLDAETEAVKELGPQIAFLRVHSTDQDADGWMGKGDPFAFDAVNA